MNSWPNEPDPELAAMLDRARPQPDPEWRRATRDELVAPPRRRRRPVILGAGLAGGLAALLLALSLADAGPLGGDDDTVEAKDRCRTVQVTRTERLPRLAVDESGTPRIEYRRKRVTRSVRRCDG